VQATVMGDGPRLRCRGRGQTSPGRCALAISAASRNLCGSSQRHVCVQARRENTLGAPVLAGAAAVVQAAR
jgi:hypothetical protein